MDIDGAPNPNGNGESKKSNRKYYVGDDGPGVWRAGMEIDNFMLDGIGMSSTIPSIHGLQGLTDVSARL